MAGTPGTRYPSYVITPASPTTAPPKRVTAESYRSESIAHPSLTRSATEANRSSFALVLFSCAFCALTLWPELHLAVPNLNDDAFHYALAARAEQALLKGDNPVDHWMPGLELGFPQFFYYQHLPHLAAVGLHLLLLRSVGLFTIFNLIRYLLLVGFPITVFWSMRRMEFDTVAAAIAAAFAPLISANYLYGFEYNSYIWGGFGMYTQLWAMHLFFVALACLYQVLYHGRGWLAAVIACVALVLSHLIYAYMLAVTVLIFLAVPVPGPRRITMRRVATTLWPRLRALAAVSIPALIVTSYFWLPFIREREFLSVSPYLQSWKYDSFGAAKILKWTFDGDLLDYRRLPVMTLLMLAGIGQAFWRRALVDRLALAIFVLWELLFFGRTTWGAMADMMPMHQGLLFHRFAGGVDLGAIVLVGLGGEWLWRRVGSMAQSWRTLAPLAVIFALMAPAMAERWHYYVLNARWMGEADRQLEADHDVHQLLASLKGLPPGRTYAGLRSGWGSDMHWGSLHLYDLLTFEGIAAVSPPYQGLSLNSDLIWHFDDHSATDYALFAVRYVIAPKTQPMPSFLQPLVRTSRYTLYSFANGDYAQPAHIVDARTASSQRDLFEQNRQWLLSNAPADGRFLSFRFGAHSGRVRRPGVYAGATIDQGLVTAQSIDLTVKADAPAALVLKMTYHPDWRVTVDGKPQEIFMVSPSYIGVTVPGGLHRLHAEYRSSALKNWLLIVGVAGLVASIAMRRRLERMIAIPAESAFDTIDEPTGQNMPAALAPSSLGIDLPAGILGRHELSAVAAIAAIAAAIRLYHLSTPSLWVDEGWSYAIATAPWSSMWHVIASRETNMGLYYAMLRPWISVFGGSEVALRMPSVLASLATIPIVYATGRRMFGGGAGIAAALLVALNPLSICYAREARAYALEMMLVALGVWFLLRALRDPSRWNLGGWVVASTLAAFMHSMAIAIVPAQLLALAVCWPEEIPWRRLSLSAAAIAILTVPLIALIALNDHGQVNWIPSLSWQTVGQALFGVLGAMADTSSGDAVAAAYGAGAILGVAVAVWNWRRDRWRSACLALTGWGLALPLLLTLTFSLHKPILYYRYLIFTMPLLCLLVAGGLSAIRSRVIRAGLLALLLAASGWHSWFMMERYPRYDWRLPATYLAEHALPTDALAVRYWPYRILLEYYSARRTARENFPRVIYPDWGPDLFIGPHYVIDAEAQQFMAEHLLAQIDSAAAQGHRLWFVTAGESMGIFDRWASLEAIVGRMTRDYASVQPYTFGGFTIFLCAEPRPVSHPAP